MDKAIADNRNASARRGAVVDRQDRGRSARPFRHRDPEDRARPRSTEIDARLSFDTDGHRQEAPRTHRALRESRHCRASACSSRSPRPGKASRPPRCSRRKASTATSRCCSRLPQAVACAEAKVAADLALRRPDSRLVQEERPARNSAGAEDPGVQSRDAIYTLLQEIRLQDRGHGRELPQRRRDPRARRLRFADHQPEAARRTPEIRRPGRAQARSPENAKSLDLRTRAVDEKSFRWLLNEDAMATEKTSEGIRLFVADIIKLEKLIVEKLNGGGTPKTESSSKSGA